ncbi:TetR/AcrR family transcriptional regulator [Hazenella sp. IB182357]|uniref:TetR/AcrR family transcriptional regulator n=2 Tax=Polycladospora coralii TaxID=2771432 RepID=A0A926N927_9BACL|nr:TetR/AcrR family transcriptional regulator [Polycladospora coralii]MBS7530573.1 TetR/AcrR family transcriptional regulator [Polycladospora coralii]
MVPSMIKDQKLVQQRRKQIIDGAVRLFVKKGFHKTTTREIASESGLSIGTMYEYIQSKEDVLYLVCKDIHHVLEKKIRQSWSNEKNGIEALRKSIMQLFLLVDEMRAPILFIYQETKSLPPAYKKLVLQKEAEITEIFAQILQSGVKDGTIEMDPQYIKLMAHQIMVVGQMWTFRSWAIGGDYTIQEFARWQSDQIIHQLRKRRD